MKLELSWNELRDCQKLWGCLCILYRTYTGGEAPPITTIQNTQAAPECLTLPQVIPTSIPIPIPHKSTFLPFHFSSDTEFRYQLGSLRQEKRGIESN